MKKIDYHMHTCFSADSEASSREHIKKAIEMGLDEICFTDHKDFYYPDYPFDLDVENYFLELKALQEEFQNQIQIKIGVEIGLDINYKKEIESFVESHCYDYVIGSIHVICHQEFIEPALFFKDKTKDEAHREFFLHTLECVKGFDCFDCLGHLDYISRYGPYLDKSINYKKHQDIIDEIFQVLIQKNKGIEINTSGYKENITCGFPSFELVKKYYSMGGHIITIGTDSHTSDRIGEHVEDVVHELKTIGFNRITTFTKRVRDR